MSHTPAVYRNFHLGKLVCNRSYRLLPALESWSAKYGLRKLCVQINCKHHFDLSNIHIYIYVFIYAFNNTYSSPSQVLCLEPTSISTPLELHHPVNPTFLNAYVVSCKWCTMMCYLDGLKVQALTALPPILHPSAILARTHSPGAAAMGVPRRESLYLCLAQIGAPKVRVSSMNRIHIRSK